MTEQKKKVINIDDVEAVIEWCGMATYPHDHKEYQRGMQDCSDVVKDKLTALIATATEQPEPKVFSITCASCGWTNCTCKPPAPTEPRDGDCQHCDGIGCKACDARFTEPMVPLAVVDKLLNTHTDSNIVDKYWLRQALLPYRPAPDAAEPVCDDTQRGLYRKYCVERTDGRSAPGEKHEHCRYFVLDLDHDKYGRIAARYYAQRCEHEYPDLASELRELCDDIMCGQSPDPDCAPEPEPQQPVSVDDPTVYCPKCNTAPVTLEWIAADSEREFFEGADEYLRCLCERCHYEYTEHCKDHTLATEQRTAWWCSAVFDESANVPFTKDSLKVALCGDDDDQVRQWLRRDKGGG